MAQAQCTWMVTINEHKSLCRVFDSTFLTQEYALVYTLIVANN